MDTELLELIRTAISAIEYESEWNVDPPFHNTTTVPSGILPV